MSEFARLSILSMVVFVLCACAAQPEVGPPQAEFQHDFKGSAVPWTHTGFDNEDGKFTFALFSDLTGGEREGIFDIAVEQLRLLRPELIVNVGDLIEGGDVPRDQLTAQWDTFDERANGSLAPVFHVGGNHDLTGNELRQIWDERYGSKYYHFIYKNVLFLVLDTEDNPPEFQDYISNIRLQALEVFEDSGWSAAAKTEYGQLEERQSGRISAEQADYFGQVIEQHPQVCWTFLLMHKPAWTRPDEENFSQIENALSDRPYTVFHGHLHSYHYEQRLGRDYIRLGTTGGGHTPDDSGAIDHVSLVTVSESGVDIANLRLSGIFDKSGKIPLNGDNTCLEGCSN
jgi:calcineurin-like phosphoesterase family protein